MARVRIVKPDVISDPEVQGIFDWVTDMEGAVPNHFYVEMNFPEYFKAKLGSTKVLWQMGELSMEEIQHVRIMVAKANGCSYCTAAFCTILNHGLGADESDVERLLLDGRNAVGDTRLPTILEFCLKVNLDPKAVTDDDIESLRSCGLSDKGVVQVVHLASDFVHTLSLDTDYDYRDMWRSLAEV